MGFSHYPKTADNLLFALRYPCPPKKDPYPGFTPFHELNVAEDILYGGDEKILYHDAQGFTRFYGDVWADVPIDFEVYFSNQEVDAEGTPITGENIDKLKYRVLATKLSFVPDPDNPDLGRSFFTVMNGRWLKVVFRNASDKDAAQYELHVRGSVF